MEDFGSDTDSEYTSYWRDWVSLSCVFLSRDTVCFQKFWLAGQSNLITPPHSVCANKRNAPSFKDGNPWQQRQVWLPLFADRYLSLSCIH